MNKEIWRLINKWQKKADISLTNSQRCLIKAATATLNLHDSVVTLPRSIRQVALQTAADIISLLGKVNRDIISKRKMMTRPCLLGDYKHLSNSTDVTEKLFGDNLTQDIKDIQVKRKIENPYGTNYRSFNNRRGQFRGSYSNTRYHQNNSNNAGHFLWRGRGRGRSHYRASHNSKNGHSGNNYQKKH